MDCKGKRCVEHAEHNRSHTRKRPVGRAVWIVDKNPVCATCFEDWMENGATVFDQHDIQRLDAPDKYFEAIKGEENAPKKRRASVPQTMLA